MATIAQTYWKNSDELTVLFGADEGTAGHGGEYSTLGARRQLELTIPDMTVLTTTAQPIDIQTWLPKTARIEQVDIITVTAVTSGGSATLTVGLLDQDLSTLLDATGLVSAIAVATIAAAGTTTALTVGSTSAGTAIGTSLSTAQPKTYITAKYTTAAFTAGKIVIRVYYSIPTA